ncbi:MAG TPA: aldo/keto reductase [Gemmatimonadales bacterium]|nr:aldo/keto reductase [Gemmatimonadales bacterium]
MNWRAFGTSGLKVSELCLGTMTLAGQADAKTSYAILDTAWKGGIRFLDTADVYPVPMTLATYGGSEALLGRWMASRKCRDDLIVATKGYFNAGPLPIHRGNSRLHLIRACEGSLRRLKTDRIDVYLCHGWDPTVPVEETLRALEQLKRDGKVLYTGVSNLRAHELAGALVESARLGLRGFEGIQPRYSVIQREAEESLFPLARRFGLGVMVYNPIAGGILAGKHRPGRPPTAGTRFAMPGIGEVYRKRYWDQRVLEEALVLKRDVAAAGLSLVTASVAWVLSHPDVSCAIIGASRPDQLRDHLRATTTVLPDQIRARLDRVWFDLPRRKPDLDSPRIENFHG